MEYFTLNNGIKMPMAGIGVFMMSPAEAEAAVESALRSGVRLIDTANGYMNESGTGRGIRNSGVAREDIFLVTKLWPTVYEKETAIDETLQRLGTDYIDLLFLHQPTDNWREGYRAIEKAYKEGKVKAIGLSNFPDELLLEAIDTMEIMPQVVQVEAHPYFPQNELKQILAKTGMALIPRRNPVRVWKHRLFLSYGRVHRSLPEQQMARRVLLCSVGSSWGVSS